MADEALTLTNAQIDYLRELVNIGSGSAAGTLSFILHRPVNTQVPVVQIGPVSEIAALLGHQGTSLVGSRLSLTGDIEGSLIFFLGKRHRRSLVEVVRQRTGAGAHTSDDDILVMVSQMVAASDLNAIKKFCGLDILYSKPVVETNLFPTSSNGRQALLIQSTFLIYASPLKMYLLLIPNRGSLGALVSSINYAMRTILGEE